jgi:hypothetical protein
MLQAMRERDFDGLRAVVQKHNQGALESYLSYLDASGVAPETPVRVTDLIS